MQLDKHRQAAARPFGQWADEWLAKKKVEKVKRGRIVAVRDPKTILVLEIRVGYVENRFGKLCRQDIKRPDVLAFVRSYEAEGKLETRDRVAASASKSATMPMSKVTATIHFAICAAK
ncbi:hypothetical protein [Bradyrhizobium zhanjiangense]|uniref:hypothetical protein n=1 Tax=Bradyrhizobium zhanjiangense TaxID=1325107 RepID=UPI001FE1DDBA|nr:hypothetical protein [Bradyrhizobium zhanjiangense]